MDWNKSLAIITIAGFGVQRALEILDPVFFILVSQWKTRSSEKKLPFELTDTAAKAGLINLVAFFISLPIAYAFPIQILAEVGGGKFKLLNTIIGALAISAGSNGLNSLLKFGEHAKEMRKAEARPLPEVKVQPSTATISATSTIQLKASVSGTDNKKVEWAVLEGAGGKVDPETGLYTAPNIAGKYHIAAISSDNKDALAIATIIVK
jgi:hypothetical protein